MSANTVAELPFQNFSFTLVEDKLPRRFLRLKAADDALFELHVEKGSASNPVSQFTRMVPLETAQRLMKKMQEAGVLDWEETYGDALAPGTRRWSVSIVFKEGVFSIASRGGSDVPAGFEELIEELYRLDFPRAANPKSQVGQGMSNPLASMDVDYAQMADLFSNGGIEGFDPSTLVDLLSEARMNPSGLQGRIRDEFRQLPPDEQERMLDALASSGMASRAWWERFLRG